jgi:polyribonucleotide nucleotidyltransferase
MLQNHWLLLLLVLHYIPMSKPMAGVRVGLVDGQMLVNPTVEEMGRSTLDMIVAGTADAVLMIEVGSHFA